MPIPPDPILPVNLLCIPNLRNNYRQPLRRFSEAEQQHGPQATRHSIQRQAERRTFILRLRRQWEQTPHTLRSLRAQNRLRRPQGQKEGNHTPSFLAQNSNPRLLLLQADQERPPGPKPPHSLRRSTMSQHIRLLGRKLQIRSNSHNHAHGRHMHTSLSLL